MATFSKASFNTVKYAAARPIYPKQLFDLIFNYHESGRTSLADTTLGHGSDNALTDGGLQKKTGARWDRAVDLGCGTGQATIELTPFKRVTGVDPSAKMLEGARNYIISSLGGAISASTEATAPSGQYEFVQSQAEKLGFLEDGSVDLVTSAQASHWFDWHKLWPELARVVRSNGTVAFWGYSEFRLTRYPTLTHLINEYSQGKDPATSMGPHWEQPGRSILDNHLLDVPKGNAVAPDAFEDEDRVYFAGPHAPNLPASQTRPVILRKCCTWPEFETYLRSFSSFHTYQEKYPDDASREDGDIVTRFLRSLKDGMNEVDGGQAAENVDIEWPLALVLTKRR